MSTQPTDAELKAMWQLHAADIGGIFHYARAVLAKWGQPAQFVVGGKPVYQASYKGGFWQDSSRERHEYLKTPEGSLATDWELRVLYTAPQPVAREQLTPEQIQDLLLCGNPTDEEMRLIRIGWDAAHGVKGGQHDTE